MKTEILKDLVQLANKLNARGLAKEADMVGRIVREAEVVPKDPKQQEEIRKLKERLKNRKMLIEREQGKFADDVKLLSGLGGAEELLKKYKEDARNQGSMFK